MVKTNFNSRRHVKVPSFPFQPPSSVLQGPLSRLFGILLRALDQSANWPIAGPWPSVHSGCLSSTAFLYGRDASPPPAATGCGFSLPEERHSEQPWLSQEVWQELEGNHPSPGTPACAVLCWLSWSSCLSLASDHPSLLTTVEVSPSSSPHLISSLMAVTSP